MFQEDTQPSLMRTMNAVTLTVKDGQYVAKGSTDGKPLSNCTLRQSWLATVLGTSAAPRTQVETQSKLVVTLLSYIHRVLLHGQWRKEESKEGVERNN